MFLSISDYNSLKKLNSKFQNYFRDQNKSKFPIITVSPPFHWNFHDHVICDLTPLERWDNKHWTFSCSAAFNRLAQDNNSPQQSQGVKVFPSLVLLSWNFRSGSLSLTAVWKSVSRVARLSVTGHVVLTRVGSIFSANRIRTIVRGGPVDSFLCIASKNFETELRVCENWKQPRRGLNDNP